MRILATVAKATVCTVGAVAALGGLLLAMLYLGAEDDNLGTPDIEPEDLVTA